MSIQPPIPSEYLEFLSTRELFEGSTINGAPPGYIALWAIEDLAKNNVDIQIEEYAPGYLAFAGNGGGEVLAFDHSGMVFMLPMIGMKADQAVKIADSFTELAARFQ